jgi:hypothetical protein
MYILAMKYVERWQITEDYGKFRAQFIESLKEQAVLGFRDAFGLADQTAVFLCGCSVWVTASLVFVCRTDVTPKVSKGT